jgi:hypothetical protein
MSFEGSGLQYLKCPPPGPLDPLVVTVYSSITDYLICRDVSITLVVFKTGFCYYVRTAFMLYMENSTVKAECVAVRLSGSFGSFAVYSSRSSCLFG